MLHPGGPGQRYAQTCSGFALFGNYVEFLIKNAGVDASAAGPAGPVGPQVTDFADFICLTLLEMGKFTVIKSLTKSACFFETDMVFDFFGDGSAVFSKESGNGFKTVTAVELRFDNNSGIQC